MSKKTLLQEASVRKFMKLANLSPLMSSNFITETYGSYEEDMNEQAEEDVELDMDAEAPMEMDDEAPMDDMEMEPEAEMADTSEASVEALVDALADTITQVTGVEVTAAGSADMEDMGDMDDAPMDDAPMGDEEELEEINVIDEEEVMNETYRRVAARLSAMNKEEKLGERITKKLQKRLANTK